MLHISYNSITLREGLGPFYNHHFDNEWQFHDNVAAEKSATGYYFSASSSVSLSQMGHEGRAVVSYYSMVVMLELDTADDCSL